MKEPPSRGGSAAVLVILIAMIALVPMAISRATLDSSELPKTLLLTTGALLLAAWSLAGEATRILATGPLAWARSVFGRLRSTARTDPLSIAVMAFLGSAIASTIASINPTISFFGATDSYSGLIVALATAAIYFASRSLHGTAQTFARVAAAAAVASCVAVSYALVQLAGLDPIVWGRRTAYGGTFRVFGTLGHPNHLAAYLVMTLPLLAFLGLRARSLLHRAGLVVLAAGSVAVIIATLSRGAWVGFAVTALAWLVLNFVRTAAGRSEGSGREAGPAGRARLPWRWAAAPAALILAAAVLLLARPGLRSDFASRMRQIGDLSATSTQSRIEIWRAGLHMLADKPAFGVGVDAFSSAFPRYRTSRYMLLEWGGAPSKAHNEAIHVLATQGLVGGAAALLVVLMTAGLAWRAIRAGRGDERKAAVAATAALAGFAVQDLASFTVVATGSLAAALAGWLAAAASPGDGEAAAAPTGPRTSAARPSGLRRSRAGLAAGILVATILFVPLILNRWRSEAASFKAIRNAEGSQDRIDALERAVAVAPWDAHFRSQLGRSYLNLALADEDATRRGENLDRARDFLARAIRRIAPDHAYDSACLGRALAARWAMRPDSVTLRAARSAFTEAVTFDSTNADVLLIAAEGYLDVGQGAESRAIALRCAAMYPRLAMPFAFLAYEALGAGRISDAADTLTMALARDWRGDRMAEAMSWNNLSAACIEMGRYEHAITAARRALGLEPDYKSAAENLRRASEALGAATTPNKTAPAER